LPPSTPIDPVIVAGSATMTSAAMATKYPPERPPRPSKTTTGLAASRALHTRARWCPRRRKSHRDCCPDTIAFTRSSFTAARKPPRDGVRTRCPSDRTRLGPADPDGTDRLDEPDRGTARPAQLADAVPAPLIAREIEQCRLVGPAAIHSVANCVAVPEVIDEARLLGFGGGIGARSMSSRTRSDGNRRPADTAATICS